MIKKLLQNNLNFFFGSLSISINFFFSSILIIFLSLFDYLDLAAELGLTVSITLFLCQIFSANHRSLLYLKEYENSFYAIVQFRSLISVLIIIISLFFISILKFEYQLFLMITSILICIQWILEIFLTIKEKEKNSNYLNTILLINIFVFSIIIIAIFFDNIFFINFLMLFLIGTYLLIFKNEFKKLKLNIKDLVLAKNTFNSSLKNYEIISSFFLNFSNLIWRFSIFIFAGKLAAGLLFGSYALGSFFGTIYYNILGPRIHSKKIILSKIWFILFFFLTILLIFVSFNYLQNFNDIFEFDHVRINCILFSLSGSLIMMLSLFIRFNYFYNRQTKFIFKLDILYSILISFVILIIFLFFGLKYFVLAYFIASLCSLSVYSLVFLKK